MEQPFPEMSQSPDEQLIHLLSSHHVYFQVHEHEKVITIEDVKSKLEFNAFRLIKTLVFKIDNTFILVALRGEDQLDYKNLAVALGVRRSGLMKPSDDEIKESLGFEVGGIAPVHTGNNVRMIFDRNILAVDRAYCGIGVNTRTLEVNTQQLIDVFKPQISSITKTSK